MMASQTGAAVALALACNHRHAKALAKASDAANAAVRYANNGIAANRPPSTASVCAALKPHHWLSSVA